MDLRELISKQTDVSLAIARHLFSTEAKETNLVFSPLSLYVVVSLIAAGAEGPGLDQLLNFLKAKSTEEINKISSELVSIFLANGNAAGGSKISFANGVWIDQTLSLNPSFKEVVVNRYKATSQHVDFRAKAGEVVSKVNSWAEKETNGLIKDVLPAGVVDGYTKMIFVNALYFQGAWSEKFDSSQTKEDDFHLLDGNSVKVPFMTSEKEQFIGNFDGFKVLGLPYWAGEDDESQFCMYILLPDAKDGLPTLVEKVGSQSDFLDRHLTTNFVVVNDFKLPRFKVTFGFEASATLKEFGVSLPFIGGALTGMVDFDVSQDLLVSSIFQKSFIEVNEEGTKAACDTEVVVAESLCMQMDVDFVADHPFMFLIREDMSGAVLFVGHVLNPLVV